MQHSSLEIKEKLLRALDNEYNVVDMATVSEVITTLEKEDVTKETLEKTRIGKYVNELRKKTNNKQLARRAKGLVRNWRKLLPEKDNTLNGERVVNNLNTSVLRHTPSRGNKTSKSCELVPPSQHIKSQSPSVSLDCSASPFCSSASNSPQFSFIELQGKNRSLLPSSYAPLTKVSQTSTSNENISQIDSRTVQSKSPAASSYLFKPVSPACRNIQNSNSRTNVTENLPHPKPQSSNCASNSVPNVGAMLNAADSPGGQQRLENSISPPNLTLSTSSHSSLEGIKKYAANKRRMKEATDLPNSKRQRTTLSKSPSEITILNGTDSALELASKLNFATLPSKKENLRKANKRVCAKSPDLKEKLSSLSTGSKLPKVKTTQQLIDELKAKKDTLHLPGQNACDLQSEHKTEHVHNSVRTFGFSKLKSEPKTDLSESSTKSDALKQEGKAECSNSDVLRVNSEVSLRCSNDSHARSSPQDRVLSPSSDTVPSNFSVITQDKDLDVPCKDPVSIEIDQILASLPPINYKEANTEEEPLPESRVLSEEETNRLYEDRWEFVNGVYAYDGSWRPWQECTESLMPDGEVLKILPFVILD